MDWEIHSSGYIERKNISPEKCRLPDLPLFDGRNARCSSSNLVFLTEGNKGNEGCSNFEFTVLWMVKGKEEG